MVFKTYALSAGMYASQIWSAQFLAYDTVPGQQLWSHLRRSAMPFTLLSVIKHMYENDEYILMDGEKRARVHPTNGVKQGCPLSPLLFSLYINDMAERSVRALKVP